MTDKIIFGFAYLRLSREEAQAGESTSIANQRVIVSKYFEANGIVMAGEFVDDGYSGSNFDRPGFQDMIKKLTANPNITLVATKDLSRLGRNMRESSYYAEEYFPEHNVRYVAVNDNFDTSGEINMLAPFQFAMNEVYIRDCSRKIKQVIEARRSQGQYCAAAPYGYRKDPTDKYHLIPDDEAAAVVRRIFTQAASGDSARKIAIDLTAERVTPPLKYKAEHSDTFTDAGIAQIADVWNYTTVKRILRNPVYLGNTYLGKTQRMSFRSKKKSAVPEDKWVITENTHEPLVDERTFRIAETILNKGTHDYRAAAHVRYNIFAGITKCAKCGYSLCSGGTIYKGEKIQYWYLNCTHQRKGLQTQCDGVRISYYDLVEVVKRDLNSLIAMSDEEIAELTERIIKARVGCSDSEDAKRRKKALETRQATIQKMLLKLYTDNVEGKISDESLRSLSEQLEKESEKNIKALQQIDASLNTDAERKEREKFDYFFSMIRSHTHIDELDRQTVLMFIDRIYVGARVYDGESDKSKFPRGKLRYLPFTQEIRIVYKFIGELNKIQAEDTRTT